MSSIHSRPKWPTSLLASCIASNLYAGGTTNCTSLWSLCVWLPHGYKTPSIKHSCPFCLKYCLTSWDISSLTFMVLSFPDGYLAKNWVCLLSPNPFRCSYPCGRGFQDKGTNYPLMTSIDFHQNIRAIYCGLENGPTSISFNVLIPWNLDNASASMLDFPEW